MKKWRVLARQVVQCRRLNEWVDHDNSILKSTISSFQRSNSQGLYVNALRIAKGQVCSGTWNGNCARFWRYAQPHHAHALGRTRQHVTSPHPTLRDANSGNNRGFGDILDCDAIYISAPLPPSFLWLMSLIQTQGYNSPFPSILNVPAIRRQYKPTKERFSRAVHQNAAGRCVCLQHTCQT